MKFWSLKRVMHSSPDHTADIMREHINKHEMKCTSTGVPDYVDWVQKVNTWAAQLSEYDESGYDAESLFKLFALVNTPLR